MTDQIRRYDVVTPYSACLLGSVCLNEGPRKDMNGWWFVSAVSSHSGSRRAWPTAKDAIPAWARALEAQLIERSK